MESLFHSQIPSLKFLLENSSFYNVLLARVLPATLQTTTSKFLRISIKLAEPRAPLKKLLHSWWMNTLCGNSSAINLNTAKQLDARELRWSQVLHCSLPSAYTEVTLEFAPSFNLPQRTLCSCRDPWRSQSCISCQLFLWVQGQPLLTLGLSVICHVLFSVWIHGYQAGWEPSQALLGFCPLTSGTWQWSYHVFLAHFGYQALMDVQAGSPGLSFNIFLPEAATWFLWVAGTFLQVWFCLQMVGVKAHGLQQTPQRSCEQQREERGSCRQ